VKTAPSGTVILRGDSQLLLHAVHPVDAVNEEDQDKNKGYLESVLCLGHQRVLRDKGKHLAADGKWQRDDKEHEQHHLCHQEQEHLGIDY